MSQSVEITVLVEGLDALLRALAEAGAEYRREKRMRDVEGREHQVDYVARDAQGGEVGVRLDPKTGQAVLVPRDCEGGKGAALAGRVKQAYARSRIAAELGRKGYRVAKEERQPDGSVRMVFQRWR